MNNEQFFIEIDGKTTGLCFSASHFIPDHKYCGRLHGHNYSLSIHIEGIPDKGGIIVDFVSFESTIKSIIAPMDHRMIISRKQARIENGAITIDAIDGPIILPTESVYLIDEDGTTAELLAKHIMCRLENWAHSPAAKINGKIKSISIGVYESDGRSGWFKKEFD
jgi:6-pyruvoyltetrahydropterin/6-carboxytetrahydropterin synthase